MTRLSVAALCALIILSAASHVPAQDAIRATPWSSAARMTYARYSHTATLLQNGKVLVAGGFGNTAEIFDPVSGVWRATALMNSAHTSHTATLLPSGLVLVVGGDVAELFDPQTERWRVTAAPAVSRVNHAAVVLRDGRVMVMGGAGTGASTSVELYNPATDLWAMATLPPIPFFAIPAAVVLQSSEVLVIGAGAAIYEPVSGNWRQPAPMPAFVASGYRTAVLLSDGRVLATSGETAGSFSGGIFTPSQLTIYDPASDRWTAPRQLQTGSFHTTTLLPTGKVLFTGGLVGSLNITPLAPLDRAQLFDPVTLSLTTTWPMTQRRFAHAATALSDGKILVTGGIGGLSPLTLNIVSQATAELYDPSFIPVVRAPVLYSMYPSLASVGSVSTMATIIGSDFNPETRVRIGPTDIDTTYVDSHSLSIRIPANYFQSAGALTVTVVNDGPTGGFASTIFTVRRSLPVITGTVSASFRFALVGSGLELVTSADVTTPGLFVTLTGTILERGIPVNLPFRINVVGFSFVGTPSPLLISTSGGTCWCTSDGSPLSISLPPPPPPVPLPFPPVPPVFDPPPPPPEALGNMRTGYVVITPDSGFGAPAAFATFTFYGNPGTGGLITTTPAPLSTRYTLSRVPVISGIALVNPGEASNSISVIVKNDSGAVVARNTVTVPANGQASRLVSELFSSSSWPLNATLEFESATPFAASGMSFTIPDWRAITASAGTISPAPTRTLAAGAVIDRPTGGRIGGANALVLPHFAVGGGWITDVSVHNPSGVTVTGRVDFLDPSGAPLIVKFNGLTKSTFNYRIPPGESLPLSVRNSF